MGVGLCMETWVALADFILHALYMCAHMHAASPGVCTSDLCLVTHSHVAYCG